MFSCTMIVHDNNKETMKMRFKAAGSHTKILTTTLDNVPNIYSLERYSQEIIEKGTKGIMQRYKWPSSVFILKMLFFQTE